MMTVSVGFRRRVAPEEAVTVLRDFRANPRVACLPSSPAQPVEVDTRATARRPGSTSSAGAGWR